MKRQVVATLVQVGLGVVVSTVTVGPMSRSVQRTEPVRVPRGFVETYAVSRQPTVAGANAVWNRVWGSETEVAELSAPGGAVTYKEAARPRPGLPGETPEQYLKYISAVAQVRRYVSGLLKEWHDVSSEPVARSRAAKLNGSVRSPGVEEPTASR